MPIRHLALLAALLLPALGRAHALPVGLTEGTVVAIGGALRHENDAVWRRLVELSGGRGAKWVVLPTASANPDASAKAVVQSLAQRGAAAEMLPVSPKLASPSVEDAVKDPALVARVRASRGVYFTGGEQSRIVDALLPGGRSTPLLEAIREMQRAGGIVAGSSAGAAILSAAMIRDIPDPVAALRGELREGVEIDRGLGFVGTGILTDQHFLKRGRIARLMPVMARTGSGVGVGVDEDTAAIFRGRGIEIVGARGVLVADLREARAGFGDGGYRATNARLASLRHGDRYDLDTRAVTPAATRKDHAIDPSAPGFRPGHPDASVDAYILGDSVITAMMARLLESPARETKGLALAAPGSPVAERGFEFRLHQGPDTRGWAARRPAGADSTVTGMLLDVTPVQFPEPRYAPIRLPSDEVDRP